MSFSPEHIKQCHQTICALQLRPVVVGITGEACSGKTYLSALIRASFDQEKTPYAHFSYDDFLISRADREKLRAHTYPAGPFEGRSYWEVLERKRKRGVYRSWDEIVEIHERVQAIHWSRVKPQSADIEITNST